MSSKANDRQVGGSHYKRGGEEHWDRVWRLWGPGYFIGCITKYVERYREKNGIQDLEKAAHFLEKLIELETAALNPPVVPTGYIVARRGTINPTGWTAFVFEGAGADGFLMKCKYCGEKFWMPPDDNPNDHHVSAACGTQPTSAYVNQD